MHNFLCVYKHENSHRQKLKNFCKENFDILEALQFMKKWLKINQIVLAESYIHPAFRKMKIIFPKL